MGLLLAVSRRPHALVPPVQAATCLAEEIAHQSSQPWLSMSTERADRGPCGGDTRGPPEPLSPLWAPHHPLTGVDHYSTSFVMWSTLHVLNWGANTFNLAHHLLG